MYVLFSLFLIPPPPPRSTPLSLHDALPIYRVVESEHGQGEHGLHRRVQGEVQRRSRPVRRAVVHRDARPHRGEDRKSTRLNSSHANISYAVFCLKKKKNIELYRRNYDNEIR